MLRDKKSKMLLDSNSQLMTIDRVSRLSTQTKLRFKDRMTKSLMQFKKCLKKITPAMKKNKKSKL